MSIRDTFSVPIPLLNRYLYIPRLKSHMSERSKLVSRLMRTSRCNDRIEGIPILFHLTETEKHMMVISGHIMLYYT